jgi:hypothetical protein
MTMTGWKVRTSAIISTVIVALACGYVAVVVAAGVPFPDGVSPWPIAAALWVLCFVFGVLFDNTDKF